MEPLLRFVSGGSGAVLTSVDVKEQVRRAVDFTEDDTWIERAIRAAEKKVEGDTGRQLLTATYALDLYGFPRCRVRLPKAPLIAVTGITYVDEAGTTQTLASSQYVVGKPTGPLASYGWIEAAYDVTWPDARCQLGGVVVNFTVGYGSQPDDIPADLRTAMLMLVGHWYENREAVVIGTIASALQLAYDALVDNYRLEMLPVMV